MSDFGFNHIDHTQQIQRLTASNPNVTSSDPKNGWVTVGNTTFNPFLSKGGIPLTAMQQGLTPQQLATALNPQTQQPVNQLPSVQSAPQSPSTQQAGGGNILPQPQMSGLAAFLSANGPGAGNFSSSIAPEAGGYKANPYYQGTINGTPTFSQGGPNMSTYQQPVLGGSLNQLPVTPAAQAQQMPINPNALGSIAGIAGSVAAQGSPLTADQQAAAANIAANGPAVYAQTKWQDKQDQNTLDQTAQGQTANEAALQQAQQDEVMNNDSQGSGGGDGGGG